MPKDLDQIEREIRKFIQEKYIWDGQQNIHTQTIDIVGISKHVLTREIEARIEELTWIATGINYQKIPDRIAQLQAEKEGLK